MQYYGTRATSNQPSLPKLPPAAVPPVASLAGQGYGCCGRHAHSSDAVNRGGGTGTSQCSISSQLMIDRRQVGMYRTRPIIQGLLVILELPYWEGFGRQRKETQQNPNKRNSGIEETGMAVQVPRTPSSTQLFPVWSPCTLNLQAPSGIPSLCAIGMPPPPGALSRGGTFEKISVRQ